MLEVKGLSQYFGNKQVLTNINLTLRRGEVLGFIGRNGAGKTTFLRTLLGIYDTPEGEILWDGRPFGEARLKIGYLPEERGLFLKERVVDQLVYMGELAGLSQKQAHQQVDRWLERFGITEYKTKLAGQLSKGNQQKIQLINTLLHEPDFIVLDEPFSGLDPVNAEQLHTIFLDLKKEGRTIIFSSHRMENVETFCDSIILIHRGEMKLTGKMDTIKQSYGFRYVQVRTGTDLTALNYIKNESLWQKRLPNADALSAVLAELAKCNNIEELSIRYPSMQEIFVETVGGEV
ncbi:MAG: ABC transporter ATP-binding protein [Bacilli bacterium]